MKKISNLGTILNKKQQKEVKGGGGCDSYTGPIFVTCEQYHELPRQYQMCVMVSVDCFPR